MKSDERILARVKTSQVQACGVSDRGQVRPVNEDAILLDQEGRLMLLADGMGGHERGSVASRIAVEVIGRYFTQGAVRHRLSEITPEGRKPNEMDSLSSLVEEAVGEANSVVYGRKQENASARHMGTTVVGLVPFGKGYVLWLHVGDSRLYRFRGSVLECLTVDHSAHAEWIGKGRQGREPQKNIITRAIGPMERVVADVGWDRVEGNDVYVLCSDGITDGVSDHQMADILAANETVDQAAIGLVEAANEAGGNDNSSAIVCKF